ATPNPADIAAAGTGFDQFETMVDHAPFDEDYDGMEEVSLEQLLEGRDRPLTIGSGAPAGQDEEIDELSDADLIESAPAEPASEETPESEKPAGGDEQEQESLPEAPEIGEPEGTGLEAEVLELRAELDSLRTEYDQLVDSVSALASELARLTGKKNS
ncbi:MAG TPA: hypothetical protein VMS12_05840, partial [Thermoanaerobaculia bacterium]|nr:hypothetical protein [Thermoanaerobaculia bacterium]